MDSQLLTCMSKEFPIPLGDFQGGFYHDHSTATTRLVTTLQPVILAASADGNRLDRGTQIAFDTISEVFAPISGRTEPYLSFIDCGTSFGKSASSVTSENQPKVANAADRWAELVTEVYVHLGRTKNKIRKTLDSVGSSTIQPESRRTKLRQKQEATKSAGEAYQYFEECLVEQLNNVALGKNDKAINYLTLASQTCAIFQPIPIQIQHPDGKSATPREEQSGGSTAVGRRDRLHFLAATECQQALSIAKSLKFCLQLRRGVGSGRDEGVVRGKLLERVAPSLVQIQMAMRGVPETYWGASRMDAILSAARDRILDEMTGQGSEQSMEGKLPDQGVGKAKEVDESSWQSNAEELIAEEERARKTSNEARQSQKVSGGSKSGRKGNMGRKGKNGKKAPKEASRGDSGSAPSKNAATSASAFGPQDMKTTQIQTPSSTSAATRIGRLRRESIGVEANEERAPAIQMTAPWSDVRNKLKKDDKRQEREAKKGDTRSNHMRKHPSLYRTEEVNPPDEPSDKSKAKTHSAGGHGSSAAGCPPNTHQPRKRNEYASLDTAHRRRQAWAEPPSSSPWNTDFSKHSISARSPTAIIVESQAAEDMGGSAGPSNRRIKPDEGETGSRTVGLDPLPEQQPVQLNLPDEETVRELIQSMAMSGNQRVNGEEKGYESAGAGIESADEADKGYRSADESLPKRGWRDAEA